MQCWGSFCQTQFRFVIGAAEGYPTAGAGRPPRPGENSQLSDRLFKFPRASGQCFLGHYIPKALAR